MSPTERKKRLEQIDARYPSKSAMKRIEVSAPEAMYLDLCFMKPELDRLSIAVDKKDWALRAVLFRTKHSCNIEYGNNVGKENCLVCIASEALGEIDENLALCAKANFENFERWFPACRKHRFYVLAKAQLDEALGQKDAVEKATSEALGEE